MFAMGRKLPLAINGRNGWKAVIRLASIVECWQASIMKCSRLALLAPLLALGCSQEPQLACSPPRSTWGTPGSFHAVVMNRIALDQAGKVYWNGKPVTTEKLDKYLALIPTMDPLPVTFLEIEMGVPCASLEAIRDRMERRLNCANGGRCREGILIVWDNLPSPPGAPVS